MSNLENLPWYFHEKLKETPSKGVSFLMSALDVFNNELKTKSNVDTIFLLNDFIEEWGELIGNKFFEKKEEDIWNFKVILLILFLSNKNCLTDEEFFSIDEKSFPFLKSIPIDYSNKNFMKEILKSIVLFYFDQNERLKKIENNDETLSEQKSKNLDWIEKTILYLLEKTGFNSLEDFFNKEKSPEYYWFNNKFLNDNMSSWIYLINQTREKISFFDVLSVSPDLEIKDDEGKNLLFYFNEANLNYLFSKKVVLEKDLFSRDKNGNLILNFLTENWKKETYNDKRNKIKEKIRVISNYIKENNFKEESVDKKIQISDDVFFQKCIDLSSNDNKKLSILEKNISDFYTCLNEKQKLYLLWFSFYNCFDSINGFRFNVNKSYKYEDYGMKKVLKGLYQDIKGKWKWLTSDENLSYHYGNDLKDFNSVNRKKFNIFNVFFSNINKDKNISERDNKVKLIQKVFDVIFSSGSVETYRFLNDANTKRFFKDEIFKINKKELLGNFGEETFNDFFEGFLKVPELFSVKKFNHLFVKMAWFKSCSKSNFKMEKFEDIFKDFVIFCEKFDGIKMREVLLDAFHLGLFSVLWNEEEQNKTYQEKTKVIVSNYILLSYMEKNTFQTSSDKGFLIKSLEDWNLKELNSIPNQVIDYLFLKVPVAIQFSKIPCNHYGSFLYDESNVELKQSFSEAIFNSKMPIVVEFDENIENIFKVFFNETKDLSDVKKIIEAWDIDLFKKIINLDEEHYIKKAFLLRKKNNGIIFNDLLNEKIGFIENIVEKNLLIENTNITNKENKKGMRF